MRASFLVGATALMVVACTTEDNTSRAWRQGAQRASLTSGTEGDPCAPGNAKRAEDDPFAACALKTEHHVVDLTIPASQRKTATTTQSLRVMDAPAAAAAANTCGGKTGPGFTTCGPNGTDSCCRAATVPPGVAGATVTVKSAFDLGIYTVTAARLHQFVDALGGNLRGAAAAGQLAGYTTANADKLPASRAAVDDELGPSCQFRGDPSNYGARSWWSKDVEDTVASFMSDDNDQAADIRKDATASRLAAKPASCVSYWMASAFCAWDGGRLPSNDEWAYAALGGEELREYPWGAGRTRDRLVTDLSRAQQTGEGDSDMTWPEDFPFFDNGMNAYHIAPPGRKPAGAGRWGHLDLAGNVLQWMADVDANGGGIVRGGSWEGHSDQNSYAYTNYALTRTYGSLGFRCAYGAVQPVVVAPPPPPAITKVPVYRSYAAAGDHLLSLTSGEGAPTFQLEGVAFQALAAEIDAATTAPLYRCYTAGNGHHYVSTEQGCEGAGANEGKLGASYRGQMAGTVPLYRCYLPTNGDHVSTITPDECTRNGFTVEGSQGFVFAP